MSLFKLLVCYALGIIAAAAEANAQSTSVSAPRSESRGAGVEENDSTESLPADSSELEQDEKLDDPEEQERQYHHHNQK